MSSYRGRGRDPAHLLGLAAVLIVTGALFIDVCGWIFDCGCRSLWSGGAVDCNIHRPERPHCPWCEHPLAGGSLAFAAVLAVQATIVMRLREPGLYPRLLLALAALPLVAGVVGRVQGWWWGYWG